MCSDTLDATLLVLGEVEYSLAHCVCGYGDKLRTEILGESDVDLDELEVVAGTVAVVAFDDVLSEGCSSGYLPSMSMLFLTKTSTLAGGWDKSFLIA